MVGIVRSLIVLGLVCSTLFELTAQTLVYDVVRNGEKLGVFEVQKQTLADKVVYKAISTTKVWFLKQFTLDYLLNATYSNGVLTESLNQNLRNKVLQNKSVIKRTGNGYELNINGIKSAMNDFAVTHSVVQIYFEEPKNIRTVFSENYGHELSIEPVAANKYKLLTPNGNVTYYTFENGYPIEVEFSYSLTTFFFKLRD